MNVKKKYYLWSISLFAVVFIVWGLFYTYITGLIRSNTQHQLDATAEQIASDLENKFADMEQLAFTLSQNGLVHRFVCEEDINEYFSLAPGITELLSSSLSPHLIGNVITYRQDGVFYRFRGSQGNAACTRILYLLNNNDSHELLVVDTVDSKLIGYDSAIFDNNGNQTGIIVVLADESAILTRFYDYGQTETLHISLAAEDEVVISNTRELLSLDSDDIRRDSYYFSEKRIGLTPLSVLITADTGYLSSSNLYFTVAALVTGIALSFSLILFAMFTRKQFFKPMLSLLESVEHLKIDLAPSAIPYVQSPEFDKLVMKLNELLERIDAKNKSIQSAQLQLKDTEIKRQKAINHSLKKQINAHFTVNFLNIIKILVSKKDLEKAAELCDGLSMLVRYAHDEDEFINAWDELQVLQNYINIMNIRYENKFIANFDIDDRLMDLKVPRMLLQPIVENAIIHGYKNSRKDCIIDISAKVEADRIIIKIRDYGEGISSRELESLLTAISEISGNTETAGGIENIALKNISRRIAYYYGGDCGVSVNTAAPSGTVVEIVLGVRPAKHLLSE